MGDTLRFHGPPSRSRGRPHAARGRTRGADWLASLGVATFAFIASAFGFSLLLGNMAAVGVTPADTEQARFTLCAAADGPNCVIDGDTFRYRGATIRIADIDTPEVFDFGCPAEKMRGEAATMRLLTLMNAGPFSLETIGQDHDRYGRELRVVTRTGGSLGALLVAEGHARTWDGARRGWC